VHAPVLGLHLQRRQGRGGAERAPRGLGGECLERLEREGAVVACLVLGRREMRVCVFLDESAQQHRSATPKLASAKKKKKRRPNKNQKKLTPGAVQTCAPRGTSATAPRPPRGPACAP
jgi:hypothetical protein